jgi:molecular chaperone GrpE
MDASQTNQDTDATGAAHGAEAQGERDAAHPPETGPEAEVGDERLRELEAQLEEAIALRKRTLADFANFQRRCADAESRACQAGAARVVRSLLAVLDQFDLALDRSTQKMTAEQLARGVKIVRDELIKVLAGEGVQRIEVAVGDEFDPHRHEAVMQQATSEVEPGRVVAVMQSGYLLGEQVLRPARVAVAAARRGDAPEEAAAQESESHADV